MSPEEELKVRQQAEQAALFEWMQFGVVKQAGEIAVLKAKIKELEQKD